jgi:predicted ATPase
VLVEGPAGIGKTHLVETCVAAASASTRVVRTMAQDVDAHTPFSALRPLLAAAAPVADLLEAAIAQVDAWCAKAPLVLWVDDAHHADPASLAVLARMSSAASDLPLRVELGSSHRPGSRNSRIARLDLTALTLPDAREQIELLLGETATSSWMNQTNNSSARRATAPAPRSCPPG